MLGGWWASCDGRPTFEAHDDDIWCASETFRDEGATTHGTCSSGARYNIRLCMDRPAFPYGKNSSTGPVKTTTGGMQKLREDFGHPTGETPQNMHFSKQKCFRSRRLRNASSVVTCPVHRDFRLSVAHLSNLLCAPAQTPNVGGAEGPERVRFVKSNRYHLTCRVVAGMTKWMRWLGQ